MTLLAARVLYRLSLWVRRIADALDRASIAKWRQWNGAEARKAARSCERDAITRVIAGSRGPSASIPASDRVESSIGRVGAPIHRDR